MSSSAVYIARRYLTSHRGNGFMSWITFLSISGISIGVAAMIVVLSVINGFETELRNRFLAANAHILAFQFPAGLDNVEGWMETIQNDFGHEITGMSPFVHFESMITKDSIMHNLLVRGIHPERRKSVQDLVPYIHPPEALDILQERIDHPSLVQAATPEPIILGVRLASLLGVKVGDIVKIVRPNSNTEGELRNFKLVGIYDSGLKHYDEKLGILSLPAAQELFNMKQKVIGIEIGLKNPNDSRMIAARMSEKYSITIKDWQSFNKTMFEAMETERSVIGLIVALVAFVASFNILTTLFITVTQKQRSVSVLKALGAANGTILKIFVMQGLFIGVIGGICGSILALFISLLLRRYQFVELPDLYMLTKLPINFDPRVYATMAGSGVLMCVIAGIYPALVASRINIVDGFKGRRGGS